MKGKPVEKLVYEYMFPKPRANDPPSFPSFLVRQLIPEVRIETKNFYGFMNTHEAQYPGLDYLHPIHRIRLSRYPWHRRMFRAFDALGLTEAEVERLVRWEGTKWAKEKFERESGIVIRDTTDDEIPAWEERGRHVPTRATEQVVNSGGSLAVQDDQDEDMDDDDEEEDDDEEVVSEDDEEDEEEDEAEISTSVGNSLNARLRAGVALREAGDPHAILDEEWESWLKNALETGELAALAATLVQYNNYPASTNLPHVPAGLFPTTMLSAARAGNWTEIPDFLHPILRQTLRDEQRSGRRTYSDLRLPGGTERAAEA